LLKPSLKPSLKTMLKTIAQTIAQNHAQTIAQNHAQTIAQNHRSKPCSKPSLKQSRDRKGADADMVMKLARRAPFRAPFRAPCRAPLHRSQHSARLTVNTMKLALLILTLAIVPAFPQDCTVIGVIDKLADAEMILKTPRGLFTIYADERTETMKDTAHRGLAVLRVGDEVSVHCDAGSGKRKAVKIWAAVVTFAATIHYVNGDDLEVVTSQNSDSHREERKIVHLYPDTALSADRRKLVADQDIRVVALDVGNGAVDAARIALYNTDLPIRQ
jgi:hypothetical protein